MHSREITHQKIKPGNIYFDEDDQIKVGLRKVSMPLDSCMHLADDDVLIDQCCTTTPEAVQCKEYTKASDIWQLGVILYNLCSLQIPFMGSNIMIINQNILKGAKHYLNDFFPSHFSPELKAVILAMLHQDPGKRPTIEQLLQYVLSKDE